MGQTQMCVGTTLIVCRGLQDVPLVSRIPRETGCRYVVASDDPAVHDACRRIALVTEVSWLEQMESFYRVAGDVLSLLEVVNRWLRSLADERCGIPADLLCWMQHAEGGYTTQKLQDAALLIRSYLGLLERHAPGKVVICTSSGTSFEDQVFMATARSRGVPVELVGECTDPRGGHLKYILPTGVKVYARALYRTVHQARTILEMKFVALRERRRRAERSLSVPNRVVFQLATSAEKHIENIVPLMKALEARGFHPSAVTCFTPEGGAKVRAAGFEAEEVATFVSVAAGVGGLLRLLTTLARAGRKRHQFVDDPQLSYRGVRLGEPLWSSVSDFLATELFVRFLMAKALAAFLRSREPVAMKLWGEVSLVEGYIAWKVLANGHRPLVFDYWLGVGIEWPYWPNDNPIDLFLATGSIQRDEMSNMGIPADRIATVGSLRYDDRLAKLKETHSPEVSRQLLGIPSGYALYVFWDLALVIPGFLTNQEQLLVAEALLRLVAKRSCALIVKPHPSRNPGALERWLGASPSSNVFWVPRHTLPYHALSAADVVLTKISTVGLEAMLLGKPVISVVLDGEPRWGSVFGDAAEHLTNPGQIFDLLAGLLDDPERRAAWVEARLVVQQSFVNRYFHHQTEPPTALAAAAIAARVRGDHSLVHEPSRKHYEDHARADPRPAVVVADQIATRPGLHQQ